MSRAKIVLLAVVGVFLLAAVVTWMHGGSPQFHASEAGIRATPEQVFPYLVDPGKQKQWISGLIEFRTQNSNGSDVAAWPPEVGTRWTQVIEKEGQRIEIEVQITRLERNQFVQTRLRAPYFEAVHYFDLSPTSQETKVTENLTLTYKGFARFWAPFTSGGVGKELNADLDRLKEVAERAALTSPASNDSKPPERE
jgi:hypothetical protein